MKKRFVQLSGVLLVLLAGACSNSNGNDDNSPAGNLPDVLTDGTGQWKVSYYWDKDKDETSDFAGYVFNFRDNGVLEATKNGTTATGTWQHDSSSNKLIINLGGVKPLSNATDDWLLIERTDNLIKLRDDNTEHLEELYFQRI